MSLLRVESLQMFLDSAAGPVRAVDDVSFEIEPGGTFALIGESGCGKSMTALSLMRLLPDVGRVRGGRVLLNGRDLLALTEAQMREVRGGDSPASLTERELDVLRQLAAGATNKGIAQRLDIAEATVKSHVSSLLAKLDLKSRTQAALYAMREGLVERDP